MRIAARQYSSEEQLAEIEGRLAHAPDSLELRFERACCLEDLGWNDAAWEAYAAILQRDPGHLGSLVNLGAMAHGSGELAVARTFFERALGRHADAPIPQVNLARVLLDQGDVQGAQGHFTQVLERDPDFFAAHHGLALVYEVTGDAVAAQEHLERAFEKRASWTQPYRGSGTPLRVLLLVSARGGDMVTHPFLDDRSVETTTFVVEGFRDGLALPPHDVIFNAIGDADRCPQALARARAVCAASSAAVVNDPDRVLAGGRAANALRLHGVTGVVAPRTERVARTALTAARLAAGGTTFPLLVPTPGHQAGAYFERVAEAHDLAPTLARVPGETLFLINFLDLRGADGCVRKYRVLFVDGRIYPAHLAIAHDWKVHYFSADMAERADYRAEEARFLNDIEGTLGAEVLAALARVGEVLDLDYAGIDFSLDADANVVVFEANATMAVYVPPSQECWAYRKPAYSAIVGAVKALLADRAAKSPVHARARVRPIRG